MPEAVARARRADPDRPSARPDRLAASSRPGRLGADHLHLVGSQEPIGERPVYSESGRRVVRISGQPTPPRPRRSAAQQHLQARPDRIALWAFLLGLFLVFMAVATASAAPA